MFELRRLHINTEWEHLLARSGDLAYLDASGQVGLPPALSIVHSSIALSTLLIASIS
jgi:hypothetical protein